MDALKSSSAEQLFHAGPRLLGDRNDILGASTLQKRHSEAIEDRPLLLSRPPTNKRFAASLLYLVAATITSLATAYLILRCFEKFTFSHGEGASSRWLATGTNFSEDECASTEEPYGDGSAGGNEESTSSTGFGGFHPVPGTSGLLAPQTPYYPGATWWGETHATAWGREGGYTQELTSAGYGGGVGQYPRAVGGMQRSGGTAPHYRGASWRGAHDAPWGAEGRYIGAVGETNEGEAVPLGAGQRYSSKKKHQKGGGVDDAENLTEEEIVHGFWVDRLLPSDTAEQFKRLLQKMCHHALTCAELLPHIDMHQMLQLTTVVIKVLIIQLGTLSLIPDSLEGQRAHTGRAIISLADRALELSESRPDLRYSREDIFDLSAFAELISLPRPRGENLSPSKFKKKILGISGFCAVVNWYMEGILLGMQHHLNEHGPPLDIHFVHQQIHRISIVRRHLQDRVVADRGARWYLESVQIKLEKSLFFSREQSKKSNSSPIPTVADFSKSLKQAIKEAGGLPYTSLHAVKYVDDAAATGVRVIRHGTQVLSFPEGGANAQETISPFITGVEQQGIPGTSTGFPPSPVGASGHIVPAPQYSPDSRSLGSALRSPHYSQTPLHTPTTSRLHELRVQHQEGPMLRGPYLQAIPKSTEEPHLQQPHHTVPPTLPPLTVGTKIAHPHYQVTADLHPPKPSLWDPSSAGGLRGIYGVPVHQRGHPLRVSQGLRASPWEGFRSDKQAEAPLQQLPSAVAHPSHRSHSTLHITSGQKQIVGADPSSQSRGYIPSDQSRAARLNLYLAQQSDLSARLPGTPSASGSRQLPFGADVRMRLPLMQPTGRLPPTEDKTQQSTEAAPSISASLLGRHADDAMQLMPPPEMGDGRSPSGPPSNGIQPSSSFTAQFGLGRWVSPDAESAQEVSQQFGGYSPHPSPQEPNVLRGISPRNSVQAGMPGGLSFTGPMRVSGSISPLASSYLPSTESAGLPHAQPQATVPPPNNGGVDELELIRAVEALIEMDISTDEKPPHQS